MRENLLKMNTQMIIILLTSLITLTNCRPCSMNYPVKFSQAKNIESQTKTCPPGWKPLGNEDGCYYLPPPVTGPPKVTITTSPAFMTSALTSTIVIA
jgi:hypothetical protein